MIIDRGSNFGDMKKFIVRINDMDVTEAVVSAHVFQDVLALTNTCVVNFNDTNNLLMNIPIRAGAKLEIEVQTELDSIGDGEQHWSFVIYRIGEKQMLNNKQQAYAAFAADERFLSNQTKRVHKAYTKQSTSQIAVNIFKEYLGGGLKDVDPTDHAIDVIVPAWTPFYALNWLLRSSMRNDAADYVLFQKHDGSFAMKSFENMYSNPAESSGITFQVQATNLRQNGEVTYDYATGITAYHFEHFDALSNLAAGYYQSQTASYDFINKTWSKADFKFGDDNAADKKRLKLDNDVFMSGEGVNITFRPKMPGLSANGNYLDSVDKWQGSRKSSMMKFEQEKLVIQIPGSCAASKWFGKNCIVDLPSQDWQSDELYDKQRRGTYLITAMAHMYNKDAYMINAELVKKRLEND